MKVDPHLNSVANNVKPKLTFIQTENLAELTDFSPSPPEIQMAELGYQFEGKHLLASYSGCDLARLTNVEGVLEAFRAATIASGATILNESYHVFPPHGLTAMLLLSESHASIHTYPEHASCFVDLFTCGDHCKAEAFHQIMQDYFRPMEVQAKTMLRNTHFKEL